MIIPAFDTLTWAQGAAPGDEKVYWVGAYCAGPHKQAMMELSETGHVILFQRRYNDEKFMYKARRTKKRWTR